MMKNVRRYTLYLPTNLYERYNNNNNSREYDVVHSNVSTGSYEYGNVEMYGGQRIGGGGRRRWCCVQ